MEDTPIDPTDNEGPAGQSTPMRAPPPARPSSMRAGLKRKAASMAEPRQQGTPVKLTKPAACAAPPAARKQQRPGTDGSHAVPQQTASKGAKKNIADAAWHPDDSDDSADEYEVESIVEKRGKGRGIEYKVSSPAGAAGLPTSPVEHT